MYYGCSVKQDTSYHCKHHTYFLTVTPVLIFSSCNPRLEVDYCHIIAFFLKSGGDTDPLELNTRAIRNSFNSSSVWFLVETISPNVSAMNIAC